MPKTSVKFGKPKPKKGEATLEQRLQAVFHLEKIPMRKLKQEILSVARKHIDCSLTLKNQKEGLFERIERDLVEEFPEFRDQSVGSKRLELALEYIVVSFIDEISRVRRKGKRKLKKTALNAQLEGNKSAEKVDVESAEAAITESFELAVIKEFLQSFNPSLLYLYHTFIDAGVIDQESLDAIAAWPRPNMVEFLEGLMGAGGCEKLTKVVVEALVLKLKKVV